MENGGAFFFGLIVFFFLLWAFAGGPSRPISFAGPFITPITNEGQTQVGYGPQLKIGGTVNLPGATIGVAENPSARPSTPLPANTSSYTGLVTISHIAGSTDNPTGYVQIAVSPTAGKSVDVTGWSVTSSANKQSGLIPTGILLLRLGTSNTLQEILLKPGDKAVIAPGTSPAASSFEANKCSGYLTSTQSDYNPCVQAHANEVGFLLGIWYVYLGRTTALWNNTGDTISLLDGSGHVVSSSAY